MDVSTRSPVDEFNWAEILFLSFARRKTWLPWNYILLLLLKLFIRLGTLEHTAVLELPHTGSKLVIFLKIGAPLQDVTDRGT